LLTRGRPKLAKAWEERRTAPNPAIAAKVSEPVADKRREHE
jgi:hypothetical protein